MSDQGAIGYSKQVNPRRLAKAITASAFLAKQVNPRRLAKAITASAFVSRVKDKKRLSPTYLEGGVNTLTADMTASISGTINIAGVGVAGYRVFIYYRRTGALVGQVKSGAGGAFLMPGVYKNGYFYAIALDASEPGGYNAAIYDSIKAT